MWCISVLDIEKTVVRACSKVLEDTDVDAAALQRRADGLRIIGFAFMAEAERLALANESGDSGVPASTSSPSPGVAKQVVEDAVRRTMKKNMAQDLGSESE